MKILVIVLAIVVFGVNAWSAPFLISDPAEECGGPETASCPEKADIFMDGELLASGIELQPDMSIKYDLVTMPVGKHTYTAKYYDSLGRTSEFSTPFLLLKEPSPPLNVRATAE